MNSSKQKFHNLDSLRFLAASAVIVHHVEYFKQLAGLPGCWELPVIYHMGPQAVQFFFVLSGFLITYLLLTERQQTGTISIKHFYQRRIVRIWPLYYLTTFIAFFLIPHLPFTQNRLIYDQLQLQINFAPDFLAYLFFLPNLQLSYLPPILAAGQCWSLGVEEQFYLLWPQLIKFCGKHPLKVMFSVILAKAVVLRMCTLMRAPLELEHYFKTLSIETMAAGGIAAYLWICFKQNAPLKNRYNVLFCVAASTIALFALRYDRMMIAAMFIYATIVFLFASLPRLGGKLQSPFEYLGKISYGLYMLHPAVILTCIAALPLIHGLKVHDKSTVLYVATFPLTILVAVCSYHFFELPIINRGFKKKAALAHENEIALTPREQPSL